MNADQVSAAGLGSLADFHILFLKLRNAGVGHRFALGKISSRIATTARDQQRCSKNEYAHIKVGGEEGIRTPGAREGSTVFKTAAIDHSATSPVFLFYRLNPCLAAHERP